MMRSTHTVAILEIPQSAFDAVKAALQCADSEQAASRTMPDGELDLSGIALCAVPDEGIDISHRLHQSGVSAHLPDRNGPQS